MADVAQARSCTACGTLTTVSGAYGDAELTGTCPTCGKGMVIRHETFINHPVYGRIYSKVGADPGTEPVVTEENAEGSVIVDGYSVNVSQSVGGQWVAVIPNINVEPVGGPTRAAALEAAKAKIAKAQPAPKPDAATTAAAWDAT
jgi:predicted RNA-binding Zn-ribbon protein involved in translation (DUF1610 family)